MRARWLLRSILALAPVTLTAERAAADPAAAAIVFVPPRAAALEGPLRDALSAHLSGGRATPVFEKFAGASVALRDQVSEARSLAAAHGAFGVFWLDVESEADWLLYLVEPEGERVLVRRIPVDAGAIQAAVEAISLITRDSSEALIDGQTIGMEVVTVPGPPPVAIASGPAARTPPPRKASARLPLSFGVEAHLDSPFEEAPWQAGGRVSAGYRFESGVSLTAGYVLMRDLNVRAPGLAFSVTRSPIDVGCGYFFGRGPFAPWVEMRVIAEIVSRRVLSVEAPFEPTAASARVVPFVSPRVGLEWRVLPAVGLLVAGGADVPLAGFSFASREDGKTRALLTARDLRPAIEVGAAFHP